VRILLELLGIVQPDEPRREPVALPSWAYWAVPLFLLLVLVALSALTLLVVRALF